MVTLCDRLQNALGDYLTAPTGRAKALAAVAVAHQLGGDPAPLHGLRDRDRLAPAVLVLAHGVLFLAAYAAFCLSFSQARHVLDVARVRLVPFLIFVFSGLIS